MFQRMKDETVCVHHNFLIRLNLDDTSFNITLQLSVFGGSAWTLERKRNQYYLHQFLPQQPDLNVRNEKVREELEVSVGNPWNVYYVLKLF